MLNFPPLELVASWVLFLFTIPAHVNHSCMPTIPCLIHVPPPYPCTTTIPIKTQMIEKTLAEIARHKDNLTPLGSARPRYRLA